MQRRQRAGRRLRAPVPDGGVPGQRLRPPSIGRAPISPPAHSAPAPASPQTLPVRGEGGGRLPSTVPGGQAEAGVAHDGTRPETSSAEGAERGGGYRRSYSRLSQGSQLEPAPPEPVTHLPNPAPARPRFHPPARGPGGAAAATALPRCACDRWHHPLGQGLIFSLASLRVRTAPRPHPARCPSSSRSLEQSRRELFALNGPGCVFSNRLSSTPPPLLQAPPLGEGLHHPSLERLGQEPAGT